MRQAIVKKGRVIGEEISAPVVSDGSLLIRVTTSCISAGTEMGGVRSSSTPLIRRALEQPDKVRKVIEMARSIGIARTLERVRGKLEAGRVTGYSAAGIVVGVGSGISDMAVGDRVAAAGAGLANHAEYIDVPRNLVVRIPRTVSFEQAASVTLGSIALHGVRRADLRLGECGVVFGAGILGLLTVQMLRQSGVRVVAVDIDPSRLRIAAQCGAELVINPTHDDAVGMIQGLTDGHGADAVLFTAATSDSKPLSDAFQMCRRKGRVVMVGVSGMEINRDDMYLREIDLIISTSYGPGRYDDNYELKGIDYPYPHVRWTENRNMAEYLRLVARGAVEVAPLISARYPIEQVDLAFESFDLSAPRPILVMLDYGAGETTELAPRRVMVGKRTVPSDRVRVALVGAGGFATTMHLPNLQSLADKFSLHTIVDKSGHTAKTAAAQFGAGAATTDFDEMLQDNAIDLVMICTRHDSHAPLALRALEAGKAVFVEKPLAISTEQVQQIEAFYRERTTSGQTRPLLMVGFNRRFSIYAEEIRTHLAQRLSPAVIRYRMNAGYISHDHWVHDNGGRIVGEACHIVDLVMSLVGAGVHSITWEAITPTTGKYRSADNVAIVLKFDDGSVASIDYFALGSGDFPKEQMEVHFDGKTIVLDDYKSLTGFGVKVRHILTSTSQKGQREELLALHRALTTDNADWPISLRDMLQTTSVTLAIS